MSFSKFITALAFSVLILPAPLSAQNTPGTQIAASSVSQDIITLFALAGEKYPTTFSSSSGSSWYSYQGYVYKFFSGSGVYAGVKDGQVYLMGGPYGPAPKLIASLTGAIASLQAMPTPPASAANQNAIVSVSSLVGSRLNATSYKATGAEFQPILKVEPKASLNAIYVYATSSTTGILGRTVRKFDFEGNQDTTYGTAGTVVQNSSELELSYSAFTVDSTGRAYMIGRSNAGLASSAAITRYTAQGALDGTFGTGGRLVLSAVSTSTFPVLHISVAIALPDDSLLLAGRAHNTTNGYVDNHWVVINLNANGTVDQTFGTNGITTIRTGTNDIPNVLTVGANGSIYVAGKLADTTSAIYMLDSNGKGNLNFGTLGKGVLGTGTLTTFHDVEVNSSGEVFGIGTQSPGTVKQGLVSKLTATGIADTSYGTSGNTVVNYYEIFPGADTYNDELTNGWFDQSGKLVVGGMSYQTGTKADYLTVSRLNTNGSLDSTFYDRTDATRLERITWSSYAVDLAWDSPGQRAPVFPNQTGTQVITMGKQANTNVYSFMSWQ